MVRHLISIAALILGTLSANAQALSLKSNLDVKPVQQSVSATPVKLNVTGVKAVAKSKNYVPGSKRYAADDVQLSALYNVPAGGFWAGLSSEFRYYPFYYTAGLQNVTFPNYSQGPKGTTYKWMVGTSANSVSTDKNYVYQAFGPVDMPTLTAYNGTDSSTFVYTLYSNSTKKEVSAYWSGGSDSVAVLSNASPVCGLYSGFSNGPSFTTNKAFDNTNHNAVGFVTFFNAPTDTVQVSSIYMISYQESGKTLAAALGNDTLTANIDYYDENAQQWYRFASANAVAADAMSLGANSYDYTTFTFKSADPIFGELPTPVVLPKHMLRVSITGFDKLGSSESTTMAFASANGWEGYGYVLLDNDSLASVNYNNSDVPEVNLHMGFNAAMPVLELGANDPTSFAVDFPAAGGDGVTGTEDGQAFNDIDIYTLSSSDNIMMDAPDWVSAYQWSNKYFAQYGVQMLFLQADALPAGTAGRRGVVTLNCFGKELKIKLTQGDVTNIPDPTAVRNISVEKKTNDKIYNIAGQQVSKDYKGLVIKNGKKFFNK